MNQEEIYNNVWQDVSVKNPRPFLEYKMDLIKKFFVGKNSGSALDIGCGDGFFTFNLIKEGYVVDAIDISLEAIKSTKDRLEKSGLTPCVNLFNKNIFEFKPNEKYDLILCLEVLEHIEQDTKALKQMNGWLNEGGILILSIPHRQDLWNYSDEVGGHCRRYSKEDVTNKLNLANFEVEEIFDYGFPFIRFFINGLCVPFAKKRKSQINPPKNSFFARKAGQILRNLCKIDNSFINNDKGINLVVLAKK
jgi:SAM-dependent methyltransferase